MKLHTKDGRVLELKRRSVVTTQKPAKRWFLIVREKGKKEDTHVAVRDIKHIS